MILFFSRFAFMAWFLFPRYWLTVVWQTMAASGSKWAAEWEAPWTWPLVIGFIGFAAVVVGTSEEGMGRALLLHEVPEGSGLVEVSYG